MTNDKLSTKAPCIIVSDKDEIAIIRKRDIVGICVSVGREVSLITNTLDEFVIFENETGDAEEEIKVLHEFIPKLCDELGLEITFNINNLVDDVFGCDCEEIVCEDDEND